MFILIVNISAKVMQIFKKTKLIDLLSYNIADNAAEISKIYFSFYREIYTQNLYVTAFYKVSLLFSLRTYMSKHSQCILPSTDLSDELYLLFMSEGERRPSIIK